MLILAGVTISVLNSAGILKNSQSAADKYEITDEQDVISVAFSTVFANSALNDSDITPDMLQKELDKTTRETTVTKSTDTGKENYLYITFDKTKNKHFVDITNGHIDYVGPISQITGDWIKDAPIKMEASPTSWTNKNVSVTIEYTIPEDKKIQADKVVLEYALSTAIKTWKKYEEPLVIEENMTIYARLNYLGETTEKPASLTITNIDKIEPTIAFTPNGGDTFTMPSAGNASLKAIPTVSDQGGSGVYSLSLQYIWSQSTTEPTNGWQSFTNATQVSKTDISAPGTWYLWTKYNDTARNNTGTEPKVTKSNAFVVKPNTDKDNEIILTANPTNWINGDVTVTVKYGANLTESRTLGCTGTNETDYTVNGTSKVIVKTNGKMVTATAKDAMGNMITASLTITNIDKIAPTVTFGTNGANNITMPTQGNATIKTTVTVSDTGGSGVCTSSLQYVWSQSTTAPTSGWTGFTNNANITKNNITQAGTWYLWTKYNDNARNNTRTEPVVSRSNAFVVGANTEVGNKIVLTASTTSWTRGDVTVTATYGANLTQSKTLGCTGTNGTDYTVNGTSNVIVKTNGKMVTATAKDVMGNMITASLTITNIDKTPPSKVTVDMHGYVNGSWTNQNIRWTYNSSDLGSGIQRYEWSSDKINVGGTNSGESNFSTDCNTGPIYWRAVDKVGNAGPWSDACYRRIDKTAPKNMRYSSHSYSDNVNNHWNEPIPHGWNIAIAVEKGASGIAKVEFADNNGGPVTITRTDMTDDGDTANESCWMNTLNGHVYMPNHDYWVRATDNAGNVGPWVRIPLRRDFRVYNIATKKTYTFTGNGASHFGEDTYNMKLSNEKASIGIGYSRPYLKLYTVSNANWIEPTADVYKEEGCTTRVVVGDEIENGKTYYVNSFALDNTAYRVSLTPRTGTSVSGAGSYYVGQTVNVRATALTGYTFSNWSGTYSSTNAVYSFTMPAQDVSLTANASVNNYTVKINRETWDGTSTIDTRSIPYGTTYSTTGSTFYYSNNVTVETWPGDTTGYTTSWNGWSSASGTITGDTTLTVKYSRTPKTYTLTVDINGGTMRDQNNQNETTTTLTKSFTYGKSTDFAMVNHYDSGGGGKFCVIGSGRTPTRNNAVWQGWKVLTPPGQLEMTGPGNDFGKITERYSSDGSYAIWSYDGGYAGDVTVQAQWHVHTTSCQHVHDGNSTTGGKCYTEKKPGSTRERVNKWNKSDNTTTISRTIVIEEDGYYLFNVQIDTSGGSGRVRHSIKIGTDSAIEESATVSAGPLSTSSDIIWCSKGTNVVLKSWKDSGVDKFTYIHQYFKYDIVYSLTCDKSGQYECGY